MKYKLALEGESGTINLKNINVDDGIITSVDFVTSQEDLNTSEKSDKLFNTLVIKGTITDESKEQTRELLEWSVKTDKANIYKNVSLIVMKDESVKLRDYYVKSMFCTRYEEIFDSDNGGMFVLEMRQRKGQITSIKVDCK